MLEQLLGTEIIFHPGSISLDEIDYLVKREHTTSLALQRLMAMEISWQDYLDILETCEVDIDDYLLITDASCAVVLS